MPVSKKDVFLIALGAIFLFFPQKIFAQVMINEFLPTPSEGGDWVELYNPTAQEIDLKGWILDDQDTKTNMLTIEEATISAYGFWLFSVGNRLNKNGDTVFLFDDQGRLIDEHQYSFDPGENISFGRNPDGGTWGICYEPTPETENKCILPSPNPSSSESDDNSESAGETKPSPSPESSFLSGSSPQPRKIMGATLLGKVLGEEESSPAGFFPWEGTEEENQTTTESGKNKFIPLLLISFGLIFLVASGTYLWYTQPVRKNEKN